MTLRHVLMPGHPCIRAAQSLLFAMLSILMMLHSDSVARGIWDGAQLELITTDPKGVFIPGQPGLDKGIALDTQGRVYVVYSRSRFPQWDSLFFAYKDPGQLWSPEVPLPVTMRFAHAGVAVTPGDNVAQFVFLDGGYYEDTYIVHGVYDLALSSWTLDTVALTTRNLWDRAGFSFDLDSLGGVHVAWYEPMWNAELGIIVDRQMYAENTTGIWRAQVVADIGYGGSVTAEPDGRVHITYSVRRDNHNLSVFAANRSRGDTAWVADSLDTAPATYSAYSLQLGQDGSSHVLFGGADCYSCISYRLFYTWRPPGEMAWAPWRQIFDTSGGGLLRLDCTGRAHILHSWYHPEAWGATKFYATNESGTWINQRISFGGLSEVKGIPLMPSYVIDRYQRAHAVLVAGPGADDFELYYYAAPTVLFDVFDVVKVIDYVYLTEQGTCDPLIYDADCNEEVDVADLMALINYVFRGGPRGCR